MEQVYRPIPLRETPRNEFPNFLGRHVAPTFALLETFNIVLELFCGFITRLVYYLSLLLLFYCRVTTTAATAYYDFFFSCYFLYR